MDNGSTNNFIQESIVAHLGLEVKPINSFDIFVGSGASIPCSGVFRKVALSMQNITIVEDIFILKMEGANIVLGCQWLEKLGPITTDQRKLTMEFEGPRGKIRLKGDPHLVETAMSGNSLKRMWARGRVVYYCQLQFEFKGSRNTMTNSKEIDQILTDHEYVFTEPSEVPPERRLNHQIILAPNMPPINVHPYRYPQFQKNEIEKLT